MKSVFDVIKKKAIESSVTESYADVIDILIDLRDSRSEIVVCFEGDNIFYPSLVTAVSPRHHVMTIRDSIPAAPSALLRDKPVLIKASKQARELTFECQFIEPLVSDFSLGYQITIPDKISTETPRQAFRIMLDEIRNRVRVTLQGPGSEIVNGTVQDISQLGIGMKTDSALPQFLSQDSQDQIKTVGCNIELDNNSRISCSMEIRNVRSGSSSAHGTLIGGRILDIEPQDSNLLAGFIAQLKKEHLRAYA